MLPREKTLCRDISKNSKESCFCSYYIICFYILKIFFKKIENILCFFYQINIFLIFLNYFDALISKIIFKIIKKIIILIYL